MTCVSKSVPRANPPAARLADGAQVRETLPRVSLYGATLQAITERECVRFVLEKVGAGCGGWLMTMNLDHLRRFVQESSFAESTAGADLIIPDGMPLIWASHVQKTPLPERVTGSNLIWSLSEGAAARGYSIFLLGGSSTTARRSAQILQATYPRLRVAGIYMPPFGFEHDAGEIEGVCEAVRRAQPDIVYVALGSPKEDNLIEQLREYAPRAWLIGVGITFSLVSGDVPRAPVWIQQAGLEWLHRLWHEPRRLARRYLIDDLPFAAQLFLHAFRVRMSQTHGQTK